MKATNNFVTNPNGTPAFQRTLDDTCGLPDNYILNCRPKSVGGVGNRIYLAKKTDITGFNENADGSILDFIYAGTDKFVAIDCLPNQNGVAAVLNGADGAGSLNYTVTFTFAVESWNQTIINIQEKLSTTRGLVAIYTNGETNAANENRLFAVGFTGDGLDIPALPRVGPGTAKTDPTGFQMALAGTQLYVSKEITPAGTNAQFIANNLTNSL